MRAFFHDTHYRVVLDAQYRQQLGLERFDRILEIDETDLTCRAESGVNGLALEQKLNERGLFTWSVIKGWQGLDDDTHKNKGKSLPKLTDPRSALDAIDSGPHGPLPEENVFILRDFHPYMMEAPDVIRKKFKPAVTDSGREVRYDPAEKPGVSNLLEIMSVATGEPIDALQKQFDNAGYGEFKEAVGESVVALLTPIRERFEALRRDERELQRLLAVGADKARRAAEPTLELMVDRMGFVKPEAGRLFGAAKPRGL